MKRILSILLLAAMLTACGTGTTQPENVSGNSAASDVSVSGDTSPETEAEPDYSDFVFPEETDTLVVYSSGMLVQTMNPAIKIFEEMYPHINVDYRVLEEDEHQTLIQTEIPPERVLTLFSPTALTCRISTKRWRQAFSATLTPIYTMMKNSVSIITSKEHSPEAQCRENSTSFPFRFVCRSF